MTYAITGIQRGLGPGEKVPIRREIDEWWDSQDLNDVNQKTLFILALHEFQQMDPDEMLSYFRVAGIHGQPLTPWDTTTPKGDFYCPHGSVLFPTWHRPYVLLYEQRLYEIMVNIVNTTFAQSDYDAMMRAAETWRMPYWDWAMKKPDWRDPNNPSKLGCNAPKIVTLEKVQIKDPNPNIPFAEVDNPMWKFAIPGNRTFGSFGVTPQNTKIDGQPVTLNFQDCKATSKQPTIINPNDENYDAEWVNGGKQNWATITTQLRTAIEVESNTLPEATYRLFLESAYPTFNSFATQGFQPGQDPATYSSLEDLHGSIHYYTGGNGHMSYLSVAAFDPIFWMHHCNIDRLFAIWQALYPNKYLEETIVDGQTISPTQPLTPFHKDANGTYWNSNLARQTVQMGFSYTELQPWLPIYKNPDGSFNLQTYQDAIRSKIEVLYSSTGKSTLQLRKHAEIATALLAAIPKENLLAEHFPPDMVASAADVKAKHPHAGLIDAHSHDNWTENDYIVNVVYERFALDGNPFVIRVFLGPVPTGDAPVLAFDQTPTQVGVVFNFSAPITGRGDSADGCSNCKRQKDSHAKMTGQVILTDYLVEHIKGSIKEEGMTLDSLSEADVTEYLKTNLHWRVSDVNDVLIPREHMPSLKVSVAVGTATHYLAATRFSKYEKYKVLYEITEGRPCGLVEHDKL